MAAAPTRLPVVSVDALYDDPPAPGPSAELSEAVAAFKAGVTSAANSGYVKIVTPSAGTEHPWKGEVYGIPFVEGVGFTADRAAAERIVAEFPDYKLV